MKTLVSIATSVALLAAGQADATILSGTVTGGTAQSRDQAQFFKLTVPFTVGTSMNAVGDDDFQNSNLYGFDEEQNIVAPVVIETDVGVDVPVGGVVASHYIAFDPVGGRNILAEITFDAPVFGIATSTAFLAASDFLANTGVTYNSPGLRGLERGDSVMLKAGDPNTIVIDWTANSPGDYVRVFTQFSPTAEIPVPGAFWLFGAGAAALIRGRRMGQAG